MSPAEAEEMMTDRHGKAYYDVVCRWVATSLPRADCASPLTTASKPSPARTIVIPGRNGCHGRKHRRWYESRWLQITRT
jgi:hypothetical protein